MLLPLFDELNLLPDGNVSISQSADGENLGSGLAGMVSSVLSFLGLNESALGVLGLIAGFFWIKGMLVFIALGYNSYLRGQLLYNIMSMSFINFTNVEYQYYTKRSAGYFSNVLNEQSARSLDAFRSLTLFVTQFISASIAFTLAFMVAWRFGLIAILAGIFLMPIFKFLNLYVRTVSRIVAAQKTALLNEVIQATHGFKYLTATNRMTQIGLSVKRLMRSLAAQQARAGFAAAFTQAIREPLAVTFIALLLITQLFYFKAELAPILVSIIFFYRGLNSAIGMQGSWQNGLEFVGSIELVSNELENLRAHQKTDGSEKFTNLKRAINLERVSFSYDGEAGYKLGPVDIEIGANKTVAIVGPSGSGKSTIADLLTLSLRPASGTISIDGQPIDALEASSWLNEIGYVSQEAVIFDDTILNNVSFFGGISGTGKTEVLRRAKEAAAQAGLADFIEQLPHGYDSQVGERGVSLSGGQRQRLVVARELYRRPALLILDEATSALDAASEKLVQESIDRLGGQMTIVIIAHRLTTIRKVDYVYVLDNGLIAEHGPFDYLKEKDGSRLQNMILAQEI